MKLSHLIIMLLLLLPCFSAAAMEWPLANAVMVSNFGFNNRGRPLLGTIFEGEGEILAAETGEIIFTRSERDFASRLPSPLGAWSAIDHSDGLISIYGHCMDDKHHRPLTQVDRGIPIARTGSSGWSEREGFYFILYDRKERRWVNASMVISMLSDTVPPQILGIQLRNTDGRIIESNPSQRISQGRYSILVNAIDMQAPRGLPHAPFKIICSVNGMEIGNLSFETICARDGVLMVTRNSLIPALRVYENWPAYEAGEMHFSRGQAAMEIIVQDISGNSRNALTRLNIGD